MARAPTLRLPRGTRPDQPVGLNRRLRRWLAVELRRLRPVILASAVDCHADRYRKHFRALAHAILLLFHGLARGPSLTQSYEAFGACRTLVILGELAVPDDSSDEEIAVSFSQFAASNTSRPSAFLAGLVPVLAERVRLLGGQATQTMPADVRILDGTFLRLSLKLVTWLPNQDPSDIPGVRLQIQYTPATDLPAYLLMTDSHTNDCQAFDRLLDQNPDVLTAWRGQTLVLDLGYYSHRRFARLRDAGVHLVTRLNAQATVVVTANRPIQQPLPDVGADRIILDADQQITLGSAQNSAGAVLPGLRLVTATVAPSPAAARRGAKPVVYRLLTDRWDLTPVEVVQIYLWRWQIELFFRWLKRHVHLLRVLGYSRTALDLTVWLSIIVHLLTTLATHALGLPRRTPSLLHRLVWALALLSPADSLVTELSAHQLAFGESPPLAGSP